MFQPYERQKCYMKNTETLCYELKQIVGENNCILDIKVNDYNYDNCIPQAIVEPETFEDIQNILLYASKSNLTVVPAGSGTKLGIGNLAKSPDIVISTKRLNKVIEYEPPDLTVTVEAGIRLNDLQAILSKQQQFLPFDPPSADRCTIGGIVATNTSGPLRLRYGTARNLVLGMHVVHADGKMVKSGGKVVKNVAGYDLNKLYIGAFGTLGIITDVSLKLAPIPSHQEIVVVQFHNIQDAVNTGLNVVSSQLLPMFVNCLFNSQLNGLFEKKPTLVIGFAGDPEAVRWQVNSVTDLLQQIDTVGVENVESASFQNVKNMLQEFPSVDQNKNTVIVKINIKRTETIKLVELTMRDNHEMMVLLGNGVLYLKIHLDSNSNFNHIINTLTQLRESAIKMGGNLIIESAPIGLKQLIDVWGPIGNTLVIMKQIKSQFDANNILNPGRFVSNI